jgi:uncharacterized membrane protein YagU involved in acid resistance
MPHDALSGIAAGTLATLPMTAAMEAAFPCLPREDQQPLPPLQVTRNLARQLHVDELTAAELTTAGMAAHFAYGGAVGLGYPLMVPKRARGVATGVAYGLGVWAGSYLALLPALGLLTPATRHPASRTVLMIGAHVVWGAALGWMLRTRSR